MSWQVIKQPDGKLGVWSSVVYDWIAADLTPDEVVDLYRDEEMDRVEERLKKVRQITQWVLDGKAQKAYYQFAMTYEEACEGARSLDLGEGTTSVEVEV